jgi:hypothetical protein
MITFPALIDGVRTLKDGSIRITLETPELSSEGIAQIFDFRNKQVFAGLNETPLKPEQLEIPDYKLVEKHEKSPGTRLRSVIYRYWEQVGSKQDFDPFYKSQIEGLINLYKQKLN